MGLESIIDWIYTASDGPKLMSRIVEDCERLKIKSEKKHSESKHLYGDLTSERWGAATITAGALITLEKKLVWLRKQLGLSMNESQ